MTQKLHAPFVVIVTLLIHTEDQGNTQYSKEEEKDLLETIYRNVIHISIIPLPYTIKKGQQRKKYLSRPSLYLALGFSIFLLSTGMRSAGESEA